MLAALPEPSHKTKVCICTQGVRTFFPKKEFSCGLDVAT
jgi:hypothetical protein